MKIKFLGATRTVTGSCYLLKVGDTKFMVDCGMFQGVGIEKRNYEEYEFDPKSIDFVILTHAHLDHCGLLPKLYKNGFRGQVYTTPPTSKVVKLMLLDSAKVQGYKSEEINKRNEEGYMLVKEMSDEEIRLSKPIYDVVDVMGLFKHIKVINFNRKYKINKNIEFKFLRVGHALGAASIEMWILDSNKNKKLVFSGDIGNSQSRLDSNFDYPNRAQFIITECLYGGKEHSDRGKDESKLKDVINKTIKRGGNVVIPSFTYQRSQEILYTLKLLIKDKKIPRDIKIYLDSPLAIKITNVYKKYFNYLNPEIVKSEKSGRNIFFYRNVIQVKDSRMSRSIRKKRGAVIIAGHGMCAGGRIIYHLIDNLDDRRSSIVFIGFQAEGTLGKKIVDGAKEVFIDKKKVKVKADIVKLFSFSAHAGHNDLMMWLGSFNKRIIKNIFLVHAEEDVSCSFRRLLTKRGYPVVVPKWKKDYNL